MKVTLNYFKTNGKWYSEGEYITSLDSLTDIWLEIRQMLRNGKRPGLVDGKHEFNTLVEVPEHPYNHLHMIMRDSL